MQGEISKQKRIAYYRDRRRKQQDLIVSVPGLTSTISSLELTVTKLENDLKNTTTLLHQTQQQLETTFNIL
jgi:hypothetical protein